MTKVGFIRFLMLLLFSQAVYAQKVKYKDIFGLLSTKQYVQAEPFLKRYLKENDDDPNAFLYMGIIYQDKASKNDILKQTTLAFQSMDSAIFFYDKTLKTVDEKEIKRNKEYYEIYSRRDLRTGEFGIKLSDVQFDLEKKIEGLKERIDRLKMVKHYFVLSDSLYRRCRVIFHTFQETYPTEKEFLLRSSEKTIKQLSFMESHFDSVIRSFDNYLTTAQNLGKTGYNQVLKFQDITDFKKDGASEVDFYKDDISLWDYKKYAIATKAKIQNEIIPMRETVVSYDMEINLLREKLSKDSTSVRGDLVTLMQRSPEAGMKKFDPDPLPLNVFTMKMADLEYKSMLIENRRTRDSSNIHWQLRTLKDAQYCLSRLDSVAGELEDPAALDVKIENYTYFVTNAYQNGVVLKSYIKALKDYAGREQQKISNRIERFTQRLKWIALENDSVPLFSEGNATKFNPLVINEEKYTVGLTNADSLNVSGYFYSITPSRRPDVRAEFAVDKDNFKLARQPYVKALTLDNSGQLYFVVIYSERPVKEKYAATVAKIYRTDGLAWVTNYLLDQLPSELIFTADTGGLSIKLTNGELSVLDKNGKQVKGK